MTEKTQPVRKRRLDLRMNTQVDEFLAGPYEPETDSRPAAGAAATCSGLTAWSPTPPSRSSSTSRTRSRWRSATNAQMGIMSSLANLAAALALLPGARLDERVQSRRRIVVATSVIHRLLLIAIAMLPLLFERPRSTCSWRLSRARLLLTTGLPCLVRAHRRPGAAAIRGRYFGSRNIGLGLAALIATPLAGRLAESIGLPGGYQVSFVLAAFIGLGATIIFSRIPDPPRSYSPPTEVAAETQPILDLLRSHPRFAAFSAVAVLWNLSIMVAGPYFSVYIVRDLGAGPTLIGLLAASASLFNIVGQRIWGQLNDRKGPAWVMGVTGLLIPLVPALYALAPNPWFLIGVEAISGFCWSGYSLASFNLMLGLAPAEQRARFSAVYQIAVFGASFVGPLIGMLLVGIWDIKLLFWVSAIGRVIASILFMITVRSGSARE